MKESVRLVLREWLVILEDDKSLIVGPSEKYRMLCDAEFLADSVLAESALTSTALEEKIRSFTRESGWGPLTVVEAVHLGFRLDLGKFIVEEILEGESDDFLLKIVHWPDWESEADIRAWLLIDVWDTFGSDYINCWADGFNDRVVVDENTGTFWFKTPKREEPR